ncbi:MAG: transporter substrate-binding domain-containing protein [Polaromonas sp.]|nr:transporter substrate-binding domain-containing protein [Polaromonas sp.]
MRLAEVTLIEGKRPACRAARWGVWLASLLCLLPALPLWAADPVRVGVYQNSPKVDYTAAGRAEGIFVDLIEAIAKKEGWTLEYVPGTFSDGLSRLAQGQIDLMTDVALTSEREGLYAFHGEAVLSSWNQVYARRGSGIRSLLDLDNKRVAVLQGSMQQDFVRQMMAGFSINPRLVPLPDFATAFRAVAEGRADAVVTNRFYGARHAAASDLEDTAIIFNPSRLYFAAPKSGDPALLAAIDRQLLAFRNDSSSVYYSSLRRWTAGDLRKDFPPWVKWAVLATTLLLLASLAWGVALRRTAGRLRDSEQRQRQLALELGVAKEAAEAADRMKSAFLATMSHELRTPLNSIIGFTGIVLQGLAGPLNDEQARQLGMVRDSSRHLLALINDVLDISRIEAGELGVASAPFDLVASIRKVIGIVGPLADRKGLSLDVRLAPDVDGMTGDARRVEQILLNLLGNAIKFTELGGVTLDVSLLAGWQAGPAQALAAAVRMSITDTGIGIRPEDMAMLFKPFRQVDSVLSRKHEGTGLGLAICRRLAGLMGGTIDAESVWQQGSVFSVTLPLGPTGAGKPG